MPPKPGARTGPPGGALIVIVYPQCHGVGGIARYLDGLLSHLPAGAAPPDAPRPALSTSLPGSLGPPPARTRPLTSPSSKPDPVLIHLITGRDPQAPPGPPLRWPGVQVTELPLPDHRAGLLRWSWLANRLLHRLHREGQARVVNLHTPPLIPGLFVPRSLPLVLTMHTTYAGLSGRHEGNRHFPSAWSPLEVALKMRQERRLAARARTVITLTEQGRSEVAGYGRRDRVVTVPNGVDTQAFCPDARVRRDIDVVFSGRIELRKGSQALVAVCRELLRLRPDTHVAIVGYGPQEARVREALASAGDRVLFAGRTPFGEMSHWYRRSRLYASTSYYEGLPGTCLEAMACGIPAVVWDRLFYRGLVDDGVTGALVRTGESVAMAHRLAELLDHPARAEAMGRQARRRVQQRHDWSVLARQLIGICEQAAAAPAEDLTPGTSGHEGAAA